MMALEIKIKVGDMLNVLVNAGIDATDAKAIIFDLLQYPEGGIPERNKLRDIKKNRIKRKIEDEIEEDDEDGDDEDGDDEDEDDDQLATKVRRPKRISFKNFGGPAQVLQPTKGAR